MAVNGSRVLANGEFLFVEDQAEIAEVEAGDLVGPQASDLELADPGPTRPFASEHAEVGAEGQVAEPLERRRLRDFGR